MVFHHIVLSLFFMIFSVENTVLSAQYRSTNTSSGMHNLWIQPPYLKPGDTVAIIAPSGVLIAQEEAIKKAVLLLKTWKLHVVMGKYLFHKNGHFAGTDQERAADVQEALDNPAIKAIWCARGGYGSIRISDSLEYTRFKDNPKWIIGYSDITVFHNQLHRLGYETIHAMMGSSLKSSEEIIENSISTFKNAIFGKPLEYSLQPSQYNRTGTATGPLVGGNLTLMHTMLGSPTSLNTTGKIIFLEEVGEYMYHIDRMLQSLKRAGYFEDCKGLIIGHISKVKKNTVPFGRSIEALILDVVSEYDFPVLFNFPAGHENDNRAMILGRTITLRLTTDSAEVKFHY